MIVKTSIGIGEHRANQIVELPIESLSPSDRSKIFDDFSTQEDANTSFKLSPEKAHLLLKEMGKEHDLPKGEYFVEVSRTRPSFTQNSSHGKHFITAHFNTSQSKEPSLTYRNFNLIERFEPNEFMPIFQRLFFTNEQ